MCLLGGKKAVGTAGVPTAASLVDCCYQFLCSELVAT